MYTVTNILNIYYVILIQYIYYVYMHDINNVHLKYCYFNIIHNCIKHPQV